MPDSTRFRLSASNSDTTGDTAGNIMATIMAAQIGRKTSSVTGVGCIPVMLPDDILPASWTVTAQPTAASAIRTVQTLIRRFAMILTDLSTGTPPRVIERRLSPHVPDV
ncbi:MAG TPA: hypothetical protein VF898_09950 [Chloroflexota bacterium]